MRSEVRLRRIQPADLPEVVAVHLSAFPKSALTRLGRQAVFRYYDWLLTGPHDAIASFAVSHERCVGFCFAGVFRGATSGFLKKNRVFLGIQMLLRPWLLRNPIVRDRLRSVVSILRKNHNPKGTSLPALDARTRSFGVLAIAVDPDFHGSGVGKLLMAEAERTARDDRFDQMVLTVNTENLRAIRFYTGLGWEKRLQSDNWAGQMFKRL